MPDLDPHPKKRIKLPPIHERIITICDEIKRLGLSPKKFIFHFLTNNKPAVKERRGKWATEEGWHSTKDLLTTIGNLVKASKDSGIERWSNKFILNESKEIVIREDIPKGQPPSELYYNSKNITHSFFDDNAEGIRMGLVKENMNFLHSLIKAKLEHTSKVRDLRSPARLEKRLNRQEEEAHLTEERIVDGPDRGLDGDTFLVRSPNALPRIEESRLEKLPSIICSMVAFACNRRHSAMQLQNSLTFVACGVTEKISSFLHFMGLTVSRETANQALDTLKELTAKKIRTVAARTHKIRPLLCLDNIDIESSVHNGNVDLNKKTLHGTWGYMHVVPEHLLEDITPEDLSLDTFYDAMERSKSEPINLHHFLPTDKEEIHIKLARKTQIVNALLDLVLDKNSEAYTYCKSHLISSPPPVDPIKMYDPEIYMLKLMTASDNSAKGIGQVLQQLIKQLGLDPKDFASHVQSVEGDLGTVRNFNAAERKRFPAGHPEESLRNLMRNLAGSHTLCNITSGIVDVYMGNKDDAKDPGVHQMATSLGIKADKLLDKKDFGLLMAAVHKIHSATLAFLLKQYISSKDSIDLAKPGVAQALIDEVYDNYFTGESIIKAKESNDNALYNLRLRLRDFSTVVEADNAMRAGDIGRLISIWKRWAILAQGIKKLSAYAIHLPRYLMVLEVYLPKKFARVIKHCLLIPSSGREGHWVAKDFYLEIQNYWIKYFFNNSGRGTDLDTLIERFSLNIPLLRSLIHQLCLRSGLEHVYQNNKHPIKPDSLGQFMHMARDHLADPMLIKTPRDTSILNPLDDIEDQGIEHFQELLQKEDWDNRPCRFGWGSLLGLGVEKESE